MKEDKWKQQLQATLDPERYRHTLAVADTAQKLAILHGESAERAYQAGLLHDCAKCADKSRLKEICEAYGVAWEPFFDKQPGMVHPFLGAAMAERDFGVTDPEILWAIRSHTTGRPGMCLLEKIVYLADYIEPGRESHPGLDEARDLCQKDLNAAMAYVLKKTIAYVEERGLMVYPLSREAFDYYKPYLD